MLHNCHRAQTPPNVIWFSLETNLSVYLIIRKTWHDIIKNPHIKKPFTREKGFFIGRLNRMLTLFNYMNEFHPDHQLRSYDNISFRTALRNRMLL